MAFKDISEIIAAYSQYQEALDKINDTIDRIKKLFPRFYHSDTESKEHWFQMEIRFLGHATEYEWEPTKPEILTVINADSDECERYTISMPIKFLLMDDTELDAALNPYREKYQNYLVKVQQHKEMMIRERDLKLLKELKAKYPEGE